MKKFLVLSLAFVMIFSLTACDNKKDDGEKMGDTVIATEGQASLTTNVTKNDDGTIDVDVFSNSFDSLSGDVSGFQFNIDFENATYKSSVTADNLNDWTATVQDPESSNKNKSIIVAFDSATLVGGFPNQKIGTFTFEGVSEDTKITISEIILVFFDKNDFSNNDNARVFLPENVDVYPTK